ncbi:MAG TPA: hypothetical protein VL463_24020 [Kofleriaceae bacterium]|nr:hypothetical protein [Kofleriaceae bacterium]
MSVSGGKTATLSPAEMTVSADEIVGNMHGMLRHVTQLREKAEKEKDIIKLNCVNDKLMPMKAQVNLGDASRRSLDQLISAGDDKGRYAAYADLTISQDKVKDLRDEADACVGDALTYVGKTDVQVTGPDNPLVPGDDGFGEGIEPPVYRTPFD